MLNIVTDLIGNAEPYAWPGGYPIGYLMDDGEYLCARCVNSPANPVHVDGVADGWQLVGIDVLEGSHEDYAGGIRCAHCAAVLVPEADEIVEPAGRHWHIATGIAGYGPDGADGFGTATTLDDTAESARDELRTSVDICEETAEALAADGHFEEAWREHKRADALEILRANLNTDRKDAPLYAGKPELWHRTLSDIVADSFPVDISHSARLYVWECTDTDCDQT